MTVLSQDPATCTPGGTRIDFIRITRVSGDIDLFTSWTDTSGTTTLDEPTNLSRERWYHFAFVNSATNLKFYKDVNERESESGVDFLASCDLQIGKDSFSTVARWFKIKELRIWNLDLLEFELSYYNRM